MARRSRKSKSNNVAMIVMIIFAGIGGIAGFAGVSYLFMKVGFRPRTVEQKLTYAVTKLSKNLPMQLDEDTRLDTITPGPGAQVTYNYTMTRIAKDEINLDQIKMLLRQQMITNYKTSASMKEFRENNILLIYKYVDRNNVPTLEIAVSPKDF